MKTSDFTKLFIEDAASKSFFDAIVEKKSHNLLQGMIGSSTSILAKNLHSINPGISLFILPDKESAAYFMNDLEQLIGETGKQLSQKKVLFFPTAYKKAYDLEHTDNNNLLFRTEVIKRIGGGTKNLFIVSFPEAMSENIISKAYVSKNTMKMSVGEELSFDFIIELLQEYGFEQVDFVIEPGQFAFRGGIIDIFSFSNDFPFRIEFFGDEIDSIRSFDTTNQRSIENHNKISILPNIQDRSIIERRSDILSFLPPNTRIWAKDFNYIFDIIDKFYSKAYKSFHELEGEVAQLEPKELFTDSHIFKKGLNKHLTIELAERSCCYKDSNIFSFDMAPQPPFNKKFDLLIDNLQQNSAEGISNYIVADQENQIKRIEQIFEDMAADENTPIAIKWQPILLSLQNGFIDKRAKIACYTDHQIFERYHRFKLKERFTNKEAITLKEIYNLQPGDYVTHVDHGVARFGGLEKINNNGKEQEAIRLHFQNNDLIYVSIHALHRVSKFVSKDGIEPKLSKLGSRAWAKLKAKTKSRVKDIAKELISLYAKRKAVKGYAFEEDSYLQRELEASFFFEDTPDQIKATADFKQDMESDSPMDRLICGDVGFGKTEIAIRAAFKAVADSKQVAILVPTTVLALQHYHTFRNRLKEMPVRVDYINRFRSAKQQKQTLKDLEDGKVDILIGTHRIVSKDIHFKDLGLLIIDEEQKFGVAIKEKLKNIKLNIDTLTLTATPIPRTLQFSLMGARDMSIINTPPPNRYPVQTVLQSINEDVIRDAIQYEISRRGQVYVINNRIKNIHEIALLIEKLVPTARVCVGHGQMEGRKLEKTMMDFVAGDYDVLVATTIVESGLDIPNANTMIIYDAQNYGLSDLHQLRGRVGRTNKKAFCYMLAPPISSLTPESRKRLQAIEEFSDLGSGFNIAMRDLDIRGAGNILGGEQSGFISEIGFEMFHQIMDETIAELKENEFADVFKEENKKKKKVFVKDTRFESDLHILIPDTYIQQTAERLIFYKKLEACENEDDIDKFSIEIIDRFGPIPNELERLIDSLRLRWIAKDLGLEKVVIKNSKMIAWLVYQQESEYYSGKTFSRLLNYIQNNPSQLGMKENKQKLTLNFGQTKSVSRGLEKLNRISEWQSNK